MLDVLLRGLEDPAVGMKVKPASRLTSIGPGTLTSHTVDPPAPAPVERVTQRGRAAVRARVCTQECLRANLANAAPTGPNSLVSRPLSWQRLPTQEPRSLCPLGGPVGTETLSGRPRCETSWR